MFNARQAFDKPAVSVASGLLHRNEKTISMSVEHTASSEGLQRVKVNAPSLDALLTEAEQVMQRAKPRTRDALRVEPVYQENDGS